MADILFDLGKSIFISVELDTIREQVKEDLRRWDISDADRLSLHKYEDALDLVIKGLGVSRPKRMAKDLPGTYIAHGDVDREDYLAFPLAGEDVSVYTSPPEGTPEMVEARQRAVLGRKKAASEGVYKRKYGNAPNFVVAGSR